MKRMEMENADFQEIWYKKIFCQRQPGIYKATLKYNTGILAST